MYSVVFDENTEGVAVFKNLTVTDVDSETLSNATASINMLYDGEDEYLVLRSGTTTQLNFNSERTRGVVTISGSGSIAEYVRVLRNILYSNMAAEPDFTTRTITLSVSDGIALSSPVYVTVSLQRQNDAPVITDVPETVFFTEGGVAVHLFNQTARLFDPEDDSIENLVVILTGTLDPESESIGYDAELPGLTAVGRGTAFTFSFAPPNNNTDFFTALLASLTYSNTADEPNGTQSRTVTLTTSDGSAQFTYTIEVVIELINDNPPVLSEETFDAEFPESIAVGTVLYTATATDADVDSILTFSISDIEGFAINRTSGQLSLTHPLDRETRDSYLFILSVSDGLFTDSLVVMIDVIDINDNSPQFSQIIYRRSIFGERTSQHSDTHRECY